MMSKAFRITSAVAVAAGVTLGAARPASACIDGQTDETRAIKKKLICWQGFVDWAHRHLDLRGFKGWGWEDPCNTGMPYGKMLTGAWLIGYGLPRDDSRPVADGFGSDVQFHGRVDYEKLTHWAGDTNAWHDDLFVEGGHEDSSKRSAYFPDWFSAGGEIEMYCGMFDNTPTNRIQNNPAFMAGTLVHESWHAWQDKRDIEAADNPSECHDLWPGGKDCGHTRANMGRCQGQQSCDYWYAHNISDFPYHGLLDYRLPKTGDLPPYRFHSVMQLEAEYYCDLTTYLSNAPDVVAEMSRSLAASRIFNNFVNFPGFMCTTPSLFSPLRSCTNGTECKSDQFCNLSTLQCEYM